MYKYKDEIIHLSYFGNQKEEDDEEMIADAGLKSDI